MFVDTICLSIKLFHPLHNTTYPLYKKAQQSVGWTRINGGGLYWFEFDRKNILRTLDRVYYPHHIRYYLDGTFEVEFSVPKLVQQHDFSSSYYTAKEVSNKLVNALSELGFQGFTPKQFINAKVRRVDFYSDIWLADRSTLYKLINRIASTSVPKNWEIGRPSYRNGGSAVAFHGNKHRQIIFYDKEKELESSSLGKNKAIFENNNHSQTWLLKSIKEQGKALLRYEIKIGNSSQFIYELERLGFNRNQRTFWWVLESCVGITVLISYWNVIYTGLPIHNIENINLLQLFERIARQPKRITPQKSAALLGEILLASYNNQASLRSIYTHIFDEQAFYRFKKRIKQVEIPLSNNDPARFIEASLRDKQEKAINMILRSTFKKMPKLITACVFAFLLYLLPLSIYHHTLATTSIFAGLKNLVDCYDRAPSIEHKNCFSSQCNSTILFTRHYSPARSDTKWRSVIRLYGGYYG